MKYGLIGTLTATVTGLQACGSALCLLGRWPTAVCSHNVRRRVSKPVSNPIEAFVSRLCKAESSRKNCHPCAKCKPRARDEFPPPFFPALTQEVDALDLAPCAFKPRQEPRSKTLDSEPFSSIAFERPRKMLGEKENDINSARPLSGHFAESGSRHQPMLQYRIAVVPRTKIALS